MSPYALAKFFEKTRILDQFVAPPERLLRILMVHPYADRIDLTIGGGMNYVQPPIEELWVDYMMRRDFDEWREHELSKRSDGGIDSDASLKMVLPVKAHRKSENVPENANELSDPYESGDADAFRDGSKPQWQKSLVDSEFYKEGTIVSIDNLEPHTGYVLRLVARNDVGTSYGVQQNVTTTSNVKRFPKSSGRLSGKGRRRASRGVRDEYLAARGSANQSMRSMRFPRVRGVIVQADATVDSSQVLNNTNPGAGDEGEPFMSLRPFRKHQQHGSSDCEVKPVGAASAISAEPPSTTRSAVPHRSLRAKQAVLRSGKMARRAKNASENPQAAANPTTHASEYSENSGEDYSACQV